MRYPLAALKQYLRLLLPRQHRSSLSRRQFAWPSRLTLRYAVGRPSSQRLRACAKRPPLRYSTIPS
jgi:hypothetical protein